MLRDVLILLVLWLLIGVAFAWYFDLLNYPYPKDKGYGVAKWKNGLGQVRWQPVVDGSGLVYVVYGANPEDMSPHLYRFRWYAIWRARKVLRKRQKRSWTPSD